MFDSVLNRRKLGQQRALGSGVSIGLHALVLGTVAWISSRPAPPKEVAAGVKVAFVAKAAATGAPPPPPPPPPPKRKASHPHTTPIVKPVALVVPKEIPKEKPKEKEKPPEKKPEPNEDDADDSDDSDDGVEGGVEGGVKGGVVGGVKGGVVGGVLGGVLGGQLGGGGDEPVFFGDGMTKPVLDQDETPGFPWGQAKDALVAGVEGLILVNCVVTSTGTLKDCKILKRLPHIEDAVVLSWLAQWKFKPAMQGSKPISIKSYSIPIRIKVPNR